MSPSFAGIELHTTCLLTLPAPWVRPWLHSRRLLDKEVLCTLIGICVTERRQKEGGLVTRLRPSPYKELHQDSKSALPCRSSSSPSDPPWSVTPMWFLYTNKPVNAVGWNCLVVVAAMGLCIYVFWYDFCLAPDYLGESTISLFHRGSCLQLCLFQVDQGPSSNSTVVYVAVGSFFLSLCGNVITYR